MTKTTEISTTTTTVTTTTPPPQQLVAEPSQPPKNPIFPFFPNFQLPPFPFLPKHDADTNKPKSKSNIIVPKVQDEEGKGPNVVTFRSNKQIVVPPPLQAEPDASQNSTAKTSSPIILYQVYALGAFFISRWAWARWNERKGQGKSDDNGPGSQDNE